VTICIYIYIVHETAKEFLARILPGLNDMVVEEDDDGWTMENSDDGEESDDDDPDGVLYGGLGRITNSEDEENKENMQTIVKK